MACAHTGFFVNAEVSRTLDQNGFVDGYRLELRVNCQECGKPFEFVGLPQGYDIKTPTMSIDRLTLRSPIQESQFYQANKIGN